MAGWAAFVGLTGVLVIVLLVLARLSTQAMGAGGGDGAAPSAGRLGPSRPTPAVDPRLPRFESARHHALRTGDRSAGVGGRSTEVEKLSTGALLLNVALTQGLFGAVVLGGAVFFEVPLAALGLGSQGTGLEMVAIGVGLGVVLWAATEAVGGLADQAGVGYDESVRGMLAPDSAAGWVLLLGAILPTVAVVEELIFRGAAIGAVVAGFETPAWAMVLVSSLAFGAAHGAQGRVGMALATALGLVLAGAFVATGSLVVVIVAHYLVNAIEFAVHEGLGLDPMGTNGASGT